MEPDVCCSYVFSRKIQTAVSLKKLRPNVVRQQFKTPSQCPTPSFSFFLVISLAFFWRPFPLFLYMYLCILQEHLAKTTCPYNIHAHLFSSWLLQILAQSVVVSRRTRIILCLPLVGRLCYPKYWTYSCGPETTGTGVLDMISAFIYL